MNKTLTNFRLKKTLIVKMDKVTKLRRYKSRTDLLETVVGNYCDKELKKGKYEAA